MKEVVGSNQVKIVVEIAGQMLSKDLMEMYSPERVAALRTKYGSTPGWSLEIIIGLPPVLGYNV